MYSEAICMALFGMEGVLIHVECDCSNGLPEMSMVGYLGSEVREAKDRVRTALKNTGFQLPPRRITVNLAPADLRKEGTSFDLAIAVAMLTAAETVDLSALLPKTVFLGELGLDGRLVPVSGILTMVGAAKEAGYTLCVVPKENAAEGALIEGMRVIGLESLEQLPLLGKGKIPEEPCRIEELMREEAARDQLDFSEVNGQKAMRRAAEVAAAGRHNLLFIGSPGSGKTMIARRIPTILPTLSLEEALEVSRIYSICGLLSQEKPLILRRPFRSPHHTVSPHALVGGGRIPRPGEISLADHGVLFLDELPEFQKAVLEALRQPLEDEEVSIARVQGSFKFPADVMLVAAMNPCRCGYYPDRNRCHCSDAEVSAYLKRISRPLLDRMDLCVEAPPLGYGDLVKKGENESSAAIRERVEAARERQAARFKGTDILFNARLEELADSPLGLFCKGNLPPEDLKSVGIIGARSCSLYGKNMAERFGGELGEKGLSVISGMARGIDGIAQEAALKRGGASFAVLGCGVDICYPPTNRRLYGLLEKQGGLISEFKPGTEPLPYHFPMRNRLIAAFSDVLLVLEAREKSGTLITVDQALEQGREVLALPGRVDDALSVGCNRLIKQGAGLLSSSADVYEALGLAPAGEKADAAQPAALREDLKAIWESIGGEPKHVEEMLEESSLSLGELSLKLLELESLGYIRQVTPGSYLKA